jgi:hypothetical protein
MSTPEMSPLAALDAVLVETGLLMHQVSQGSTKSVAAVERVCALVAADVQKRVLEIARQSPSPAALRRLQAHRETLGGLEFSIRQAAQEMNDTLALLLPPAPSPGTYSPERTRLATAGAWMNVRSAP